MCDVSTGYTSGFGTDEIIPPQGHDAGGSDQCDVASPLVNQFQTLSFNQPHAVLPSRRRQLCWDGEDVEAYYTKNPTDEGYYSRTASNDASIPDITRTKTGKYDDGFVFHDIFCGPERTFPLDAHRPTDCDTDPAFQYGPHDRLLKEDEIAHLVTGSEGYFSSGFSDESSETTYPPSYFPPALVELCTSKLVRELDSRREGDVSGNHVNASNKSMFKVAASVSELQQRVPPRNPRGKGKGKRNGAQGILGRSPRKSRRVNGVLEKTGRVRLFSCPFHKWKPATYSACWSIGLPAIADVQAHLRKCHSIPTHCARCYAEFDTVQERDIHLRSANCKMEELRVIEGYGEAAKRGIESRVDRRKPMSAQWNAIYSVLFPGQPRPKTQFVDDKLTDTILELREYMQRDWPDIAENLCDELPESVRSHEGAKREFSGMLFEAAISRLIER